MKYTGSRLTLLMLLAAFTASVSGYFMGLRQTVGGRRETAVAPLPSIHTASGPQESHFISAPTYDEMGKREHQPNHGWHAQLADLVTPPIDYAAVRALTAEEQSALRQTRASRRAFSGAPPVVPHAIDQQHSAACLVCHGKPTRVGQVAVSQISHAAHSQCLQCHAAGAGPAPAWGAPPPAKATPKVENSFSGLGAPLGASRAFPGAPPVMPHAFWMRQNCGSCHGPGGSSAIKPDHAARQNCLQCHATNSGLEQRPFAPGPPSGLIAPLPPAPIRTNAVGE